MGLKNTFKSAANTVFKAFGDVPERVNYHSYGSTTYNVSAGVPVDTESVSMVSMVFLEHNRSEADNEKIQMGDKKVLAVYSSFAAKLSLHDHIVRIEAGASVVYNVVDFMVDAAEAIVEFNLRRP